MDILQALGTIDGDDAFLPLSESTCRFVKK